VVIKVLEVKAIRAPNSVLVTGCAGFIGFHLCRRLLETGFGVLGFDNLSPFYDEGLKAGRLEILQASENFRFIQGDIADRTRLKAVFDHEEFGPVINLAAQAGVRYSLENPDIYVKSNIAGFVNLMEEAHKRKVPHFVYASSSSVYGANQKIPFSEKDNVDFPVSLYAATKKSNELIAHVYAHLYALPVTGLRFFTVYGPWGRPDMALFKFCKAIINGDPIDVYNHGKMLRDFTYVDDVVAAVVRIMKMPPAPGQSPSASSPAPYRVYNIGNSQPVEVGKLIEIIEQQVGKKAKLNMMPMQPGDVPVTYADVDELARDIAYRPETSIETGVARFVEWYRRHYKL
jgi:UDP-glucuronate 4-epimerase